MYAIARFPVPVDSSNGAHHFISRPSRGLDPLLGVRMSVGRERLVLGETYSLADARRFADMAALRFKRFPKFNHSRRQAELDTEQVIDARKALDEIAAAHVIPDDNRDILTRIKDLEERLNAIEGL